jgi:hypothetical protein
LAVNPGVLQKPVSIVAIRAMQLAKAKQDELQQGEELEAVLSAESPVAEIDRAFAVKDRSSCVCSDRQDRSRISLRSVFGKIADRRRSRPTTMLQAATLRQAHWPRVEPFLLS